MAKQFLTPRSKQFLTPRSNFSPPEEGAELQRLYNDLATIAEKTAAILGAKASRHPSSRRPTKRLAISGGGYEKSAATLADPLDELRVVLTSPSACCVAPQARAASA